MLLTAIYILLAILNVTGFLICVFDKHRARKGKWRVSERTIFGIAFLGGSVGVYSALLLFRHKTRHYTFMLGIPLIFIIQVFITVWLALKA
jgi:uncharacterized membrane protein YsdA (DUF1294 family)